MKNYRLSGNRLSIFRIILIVFLSGILSHCNPRREEVIKVKNPFVSVMDKHFMDSLGREIILHGLNLVNKDPEVNYLDESDRMALMNMKEWGMNCVRLGVIWDGLEPEPGQYNETYLQGIDQRIRWARENNLYVLLDMHQDLFSVKFSDGAPEWATLDEGKPHITGNIWSESYFISPAVQTAFDNFWNNSPASDGKGIQDHLIDGWKLIARRYKDNTTVIGYDLMNEPFPGSDAVEMRSLQLKAFMEIAGSSGRKMGSEESLKGMMGTEEGSRQLFKILSDPVKFRKVVDTIYPLQEKFETGPLMSFYQKTRDAIREMDQHHIIFIEHAIFSNSGLSSAIRPLLRENGQRDLQVAYAPHAYDLVTDSKYQSESSFDRLKFILDRIDSTAERLKMPALMGEWGAFYNNKDISVVKQADFILDRYSKYHFSDTYWSYFKDISELPYFAILDGIYPVAVSGRLTRFAYDDTREVFEAGWTENPSVSAPSVFFVPWEITEKDKTIEITPVNDSDWLPIPGSQAGYLVISPSGKRTSVKLRILFSKDE